MRYWNGREIVRDKMSEVPEHIQQESPNEYMGIHITTRLNGEEKLRDKYSDMEVDRIITSKEIINNPNKNTYMNKWVAISNA